MDNLQHTPLFEFHQRHGARLVPFAGWQMPVQYAGILEEHRTVRESAGLFDVSHMGEVLVSGPDAEAYLDHLVTNDVSRLRVGRGLYTVMAYENGGVVDDLIIYRRGPTEFLVVINAGNVAKDLEWMQEHASGFDCSVNNVSADYALLALQGPKSSAILESAGAGSLRELRRFALEEASVAGIPVLAARTGYTGEDGFELFVAPSRAGELADELLRHGEAHGLRPVGLGARDSLRTEAGFPLYGHELSERISPLQAGIGWVVKLKKPGDFPGKEALAREAREGPAKRLLWFRLESRRIAREGTEVYQGDRLVGHVTSGTLSPMLNRAIGAAMVETANLDPAALAVDLRGRRLPIEVAKPPLHLVDS